MLPNMAPPVTRPQLFKISQQLVPIGVKKDDHGDPIIDPKTGQPIPVLDWKVIKGANPNPNDPQTFYGPVPCEDWCWMFAGFSLAACLAACRRM